MSHLGRQMSIFLRNDTQKKKLGKCCSAVIPPGSSGIAVLCTYCSALFSDRYCAACEGLRGLEIRCAHGENASNRHILHGNFQSKATDPYRAQRLGGGP